MNKLLNSGFVFLAIALIIRFAISYFSNDSFTHIAQMADWEKWFYGFAIVMFSISFWHQVIRRRCPDCRSTEHAALGTEEIDRWVGIKKVTENIGNGKTRERHLNVTRIKTRSFFKCGQCEKQWSETKEHEKT